MASTLRKLHFRYLSRWSDHETLFLCQNFVHTQCICTYQFAVQTKWHYIPAINCFHLLRKHARNSRALAMSGGLAHMQFVLVAMIRVSGRSCLQSLAVRYCAKPSFWSRPNDSWIRLAISAQYITFHPSDIKSVHNTPLHKDPLACQNPQGKLPRKAR